VKRDVVEGRCAPPLPAHPPPPHPQPTPAPVRPPCTFMCAVPCSMMDELAASKIPYGVYSSESQWTPITGDSKVADSVDLWWATYVLPSTVEHAATPSALPCPCSLVNWLPGLMACAETCFSHAPCPRASIALPLPPMCVHAVRRYDGHSDPNYDWKSFGGWKEATIKQWKGTTSLCGVGVDLNESR
jgi:hypothetical protein